MSIELVDAIQYGRRIHVSGKLRNAFRNSGLAHLVLRQDCDGFNAMCQVGPELVHIVGAGKSSGHSYNGDRLLPRLRGAEHSGRCAGALARCHARL
jgi:hypothetical protein